VIPENQSISRRQTTLSLIILSFLVLIGVGIVLTQSHYNRAILSADALSPTADKNALISPDIFLPEFKPLPPAIEPLTAPESFDPATLSDKINGKAELYLSAGFSSLKSQRFRAAADPDLWIEAFVYDMQNGQNAFAVFSVQRRENAQSLSFARYAYRSPNAVFFVHGKFYIELIASQASGQAMESMETLAAAFVRNIRGASKAIAEQDLFPKQNRIEGSISLITADAFGFEQLNQVHTAGYRTNDTSLMAFLSRRQNPAEAEKLAANYGSFLLNFGGKKLDSQLPVPNSQVIEILDTYEIIFSYGPYVAGVREAAAVDPAEKLAIQLFNQLKEVAGDR
jgi:hypothetical protein